MKMISKDDVLAALGLEKAGEDRFLVGMLVGVGVGAIVGGAVAMLMAPRSGAELRTTIGEKGRSLVNRARGRHGVGSEIAGAAEDITSSPNI